LPGVQAIPNVVDGVAPRVSLSIGGTKMGDKRIVSERGRSLYVNLPTRVINDAGLRAGDVVDLRYIEGIGVIVCKPVKFSPSMSKRMRGRSVGAGIDRSDRKMKFVGDDYIEVIPLHDDFRRKK
jgi:hypothetical protein